MSTQAQVRPQTLPELHRYKLIVGRHEEKHYETGLPIIYQQGEEFWSKNPNLEAFNAPQLGEAGRKFTKLGQSKPPESLQYPTSNQPMQSPSPAPSPATKPQPNYAGMQIAELKKLAEDREVYHAGLKTKEQLMKALEEAD